MLHLIFSFTMLGVEFLERYPLLLYYKKTSNKYIGHKKGLKNYLCNINIIRFIL